MEKEKDAFEEKSKKRTLNILGKYGMKGRKADGKRKEKAMDGTNNKDCTSVQKTRCPSAIPDRFKSPLIAVWPHNLQLRLLQPDHHALNTRGRDGWRLRKT